jgi:hypothetical protein
MELLIDKLIDILKDIFKDGFDLTKASILVAVLLIAIGIWQWKSITPVVRSWIRKITQVDKIAKLDRRVKYLEDVAFQSLQELERQNQEFRADIESLIDHTQSLCDEDKITEFIKDTTIYKLQSLQNIYKESIQELIILSEKLSNDISASRQSLIDAPRWANEEGYKDFQDYKRQQGNNKP